MSASGRRWWRAAWLALCLCAAAATAQTKPPVDREQLERKLNSTATLIDSSSAARQIESSGAPEAAQHRARARDLHQQARQAFQAGQLESSAALLDEASRAMFEGVRRAAPEQLVATKQRADFDARLESTRALLEAQKRIAAEKGAGARAAEVSRQVEALIAKAGEQARAGSLADARRTLDQAYLAVKVGAIGLRDGDTVVRSLNFANKAQEYAYEIDRNDTHRMLVQVLLKDKRGGSAEAMVEQFLASAARLRAQAEEQASRNDHEAAVKTLEDSTRELVKAIRGAGVYIPG
jgi:hypothetical protein